ncbi:MAG: tyrosine-type recombinase/integrase [Kiritimatiellia bacterium]
MQQEKSGRWTVRVGVDGKRLSRSARTKDRDKAAAFLDRMLAPLGLGSRRLPLAEAWHHYEMSPNRRDLANSTLKSKRAMWMVFARWMEQNHLEIADLAQVTPQSIAEYLAEFRCHHSASTYNGHVCALREIFRTLAEKADVVSDPWADVRLRTDDSISRRELTANELGRLYAAAAKRGSEWRMLFVTGIYTGLRLGDCCCLEWGEINLERSVIQIVPEKTKKHMHGIPVTIPIHPQLHAEFRLALERREQSNDEVSKDVACYANPGIADLYLHRNWRIDEGLRQIFKAANISMNYRMEGRRRKVVTASFHSLRHSFVSFAANAGVPLPVVQSIVGHTSTTMTRHYYHENEAALRAAVTAIPSLDALCAGNGGTGNRSRESGPVPIPNSQTVEQRLRQLEKLRKKGLVTEAEYDAARTRILSGI